MLYILVPSVTWNRKNHGRVVVVEEASFSSLVLRPGRPVEPVGLQLDTPGKRPTWNLEMDL